MDLFVRGLTATDVEGPAGLAVVRSAVLEELTLERGGVLFLAERSPRTAQSFLHVGAGNDALAEVVLADGALVGWSYTVVRELHDGTKLATIEELGVEPEARAIGAGELLLDSVLAWCNSKNCIGVDSFALPGARETKNFFETFGLKARLLTVHIDLRIQRTDSET